jgi:hypothetical protein
MSDITGGHGSSIDPIVTKVLRTGVMSLTCLRDLKTKSSHTSQQVSEWSLITPKQGAIFTMQGLERDAAWPSVLRQTDERLHPWF